MAGGRHQVYGVSISSDLPLALPRAESAAVARVEVTAAADDVFADARTIATSFDAFHRSAILADGAAYLAWDTVGEFLVSAAGDRLACRCADGASWESFQTYMLGQALAFALVMQGVEPLHATTVVVDGLAVAFLGDSGHGKSSLAAAFVAAGHRLLTDDLLVVEPAGGVMRAHPGPPRIKLFSAVCRRFLPVAESTATMNGRTDKRVAALRPEQHCRTTVGLAAIFAVTPPRDSGRGRAVVVEPLSAREACMRLLRSTFARQLAGPSRLVQQFEAMASLASVVPVSRLTYPRSIECLGEVRDAVLDSVRIAAAAS